MDVPYLLSTAAVTDGLGSLAYLLLGRRREDSWLGRVPLVANAVGGGCSGVVVAGLAWRDG